MGDYCIALLYSFALGYIVGVVERRKRNRVETIAPATLLVSLRRRSSRG